MTDFGAKALISLLTLSLSARGTLSSYPSMWIDTITFNQTITSGYYDQFPTSEPCWCKTKCFIDPQCIAWAIGIDQIRNESMCFLSDHTPDASEISNSSKGFFGLHSSYSLQNTGNAVNGGPPSPSANDYNIFKEQGCSSDSALSVLVMKPENEDVFEIKYMVCFRPSGTPDFTLAVDDEQLVVTGPEYPPEMCSGNRVLVDFQSYQNDASGGSYSNPLDKYVDPPYLAGICHRLNNWVVDYTDCETLSPTTSPWTGISDPNYETEKWDYYFRCQPYYLAVQVTRGGANMFESVTCCKIHG